MEPVVKTSEAIIAGVDEVGRGAFAGPLIAGAVVFRNAPLVLSSRLRGQKATNRRIPAIQINDSKKLTARQREIAAVWIKENALAWGIGSASVAFINKYGLTKAGNFAFRQAIASAQKKLKLKISYLIIDAFFVPYVRGLPRNKQFAIVRADSKSKSVAAASIIAKVHRDALMTKLAKPAKYKKYLWDKNKGYGTAAHREAIQKYGITQIHRKQWVRSLV